VAAALIAALAAGCTTLRLEVGGGATGAEVTERRGDWLFALGEERIEDVNARCPSGPLRITETTTALDAVTTVVTLGLYWPRTVVYECRAQVASR
jgi:hypothetical protein